MNWVLSLWHPDDSTINIVVVIIIIIIIIITTTATTVGEPTQQISLMTLGT